MATDEILRLHYYERQYLGAADLEDQQTYLRDMRRRHNIGHHTWGIVTGLDLVCVPVQGDPNKAVNFFIQPGMAIDGFGREIIVMAPVPLDPALFASFLGGPPKTPGGPPTGLRHEVWISYDQAPAQQPVAGFAQCDSSNQFGRIQETYQIVIDATAAGPTQQDVMVNGKAEDPSSTDMNIPVDDSVPYQELPDDTTHPLWLLQLGIVLWDGSRFLQPNSPSDLLIGRVYAGVVAQTVYGPATEPGCPNLKPPDPSTDQARFFIQPRFLPTDHDAAGFAEVVGRLQVDGRIIAQKDVHINGGQLQFLDTTGSDDQIPLWMQRTAGDGGVGTDLHIHIDRGPDTKKWDQNRLSIGFTSGAAEQTVFAVTAGNNVYIPTGTLNFDNDPNVLQIGTQGTGTPPDTLYFRSPSNFRWWKAGQPDPDPTKPDNGTLLMLLDGNGNLTVAGSETIGGSLTTGGNITLPGTSTVAGSIFFGAAERQMLNLWNTTYGIGIQDATQYYRSGADFCWFIGGTHANGRSDPGGGTLAMKLDSGSNLHVFGNLTVDGSQNIFKVFTKTMAISQGGTSPNQWTVDYSGSNFSQVYAAFVVFQGFSIWNNNNDLTFSNRFNDPDVNAIPQHAYVRIITQSLTQVTGECFCSESLTANEVDNTILFTVVVMGRS